MPGESVNVVISMNNNPGLASVVVDVAYDEYLTLTAVNFDPDLGANVTAAEPYSNPQTLSFASPISTNTHEGTFATLTFVISEDAPDQYEAGVTLSFDEDNIFDSELENVPTSVVNGKVTVYHGIPGDINGDKKVNNKDSVLLFRYVAGWDVAVDSDALDCNGDGKVNNKDAVTLFRFVAGWSGIELHRGSVHLHTLEAVEAVAATCTEPGSNAYWHCTTCGKYFSDAYAKTEISLKDTIVAAHHTIVIIPAVPATATTEGSTEGQKCSVCGEWIVEPEPIPVNGHTITYHLNNTYIESLNPENTNFRAFSSTESVTLVEIKGVPGYVFEGWYDGQGADANRVTKIPAGTDHDVELFAHWSLNEDNVIMYISEAGFPQVEATPYDPQIGVAVLKTPALFEKYTFVGWMNEEQEIITSIPANTRSGAIVLTAIWSSNRNFTQPVAQLSDPEIIEDDESGNILFLYEIGTVNNVPLKTYKTWENVSSLNQTWSVETSKSLENGSETGLTEAVQRATTNSSTWTLASGWTEGMNASNSYLSQKGYSQEEINSLAQSSSGTYNLSVSNGGSREITDTTGRSYRVAETKSYENTHEEAKGQNFELNTNSKVSKKLSVNAGVNAGLSVGLDDIAKASAGANVGVGGEVGTENSIGAKYSNFKNTTDTTKNAFSKTKEITTNQSHTDTNTYNWNTNESYSFSNSVTASSTLARAVSQLEAKTTQYSSSYNESVTNSNTQGATFSEGETQQHSSIVTYFTKNLETESATYTTTGANPGNYRFTVAGKIHVFAMVLYDVKTGSFSVTTYGVLDENTYDYLDYSIDTTNKDFNDHENGVLSFEVPDFVLEYVNDRIECSTGLEFDYDDETRTCVVSAYDEDDEIVYIPSYRAHNGQSYKVTGIVPSLFRNNTTVKAVSLGSFVEVIPESAFEGCSSLRVVLNQAKVIGKNAFKGCVSMESFYVSDKVVSIGEDAFEGVQSVEAYVIDSRIAEPIAASGASQITLDLSSAEASLSDVSLHVSSLTESFALIGNARRTESNFRLESEAVETSLKNLKIKDVHLMKISSTSLRIYNCSFEGDGIILLLSAPSINLTLSDKNVICSHGERAIVSGSVMMIKDVSTDALTNVSVTGDWLYCGSLQGESRFVVYKNNEKTSELSKSVWINEETFQKYKDGSVRITFDPNEGFFLEDQETTKEVFYGETFDALPIPTRYYYTFNGWFTAADGGTQVTSENTCGVTENITLYAHWTLNSLSEPVPASAVPTDAQVPDETRYYTYDLRTDTSSSSSSMSGWTLSGYERTSWGATQGPVNSDPSNGVRNVWPDQYIKDYTHHWKYYHRHSSNATVWGTDSSAPRGDRHEIDLTYKLTNSWTSSSSGYTWYGDCACPVCGKANMWQPDGEYDSPNYATCWYYQEPVYTYYFYKVESKTSTSNPSGQYGVSNVQEWVQYRMK